MSTYYTYKKRGFTLIELLVVIAIIGILSSIVVTSLGSNKGKTRDALRKGDIKQIETALDLYFVEKYEYPATLDLLVTEKYFDVLPKDPKTNTNYGYSFSSGSYCIGAVLEVLTPTSECTLSSFDYTIGGPN